VNSSLITGLNKPVGIAVSGSNLFVTNYGTGNGTGSVGEYTNAGAAVNVSLVTGLNFPIGIAVAGSNLFVTNVTSFNATGLLVMAGVLGLAIVRRQRGA